MRGDVEITAAMTELTAVATEQKVPTVAAMNNHVMWEKETVMKITSARDNWCAGKIIAPGVINSLIGAIMMTAVKTIGHFTVVVAVT